MIFCRGCGKQIHETAPACPHCGARQAGAATSPSEKPVPEGVKGWSWGAFLLSWVWAIGVASRTIIWSLVKQMRVCLIPLFHRLHRRTALER